MKSGSISGTSRFNEAAVFRLRMESLRYSGCQTSVCFNEAAVFRLRMAPSLLHVVNRGPASMRPQSFDCGWLLGVHRIIHRIELLQ